VNGGFVGQRVHDFLQNDGTYYPAKPGNPCRTPIPYDENDRSTQVLYFRNAVAVFSAFGAPGEKLSSDWKRRRPRREILRPAAGYMV